MSVLFVCYQLKRKEMIASLKYHYETEPQFFSCGMKKPGTERIRRKGRKWRKKEEEWECRIKLKQKFVQVWTMQHILIL